jgi:hypothetical protein
MVTGDRMTGVAAWLSFAAGSSMVDLGRSSAFTFADANRAPGPIPDFPILDEWEDLLALLHCEGRAH